MATSANSERVFIGIDLGGTTIKGALVTSEGGILYETRTETEKNDSRALLNQIVEFVKNLNHLAEERAESIGIGVPGLIGGFGWPLPPCGLITCAW